MISSFIRVSVSLLLITILLYAMRGNYGQILSVLKGTSIATFFLAFLAFILAVSISSIRLKLIVAAQDIKITFGEALSLTFIGYFFNNFLPTAIGGDVMKGYYLSRKSSNKAGSYTSVLVDRAIGLVTMVFMAFIALVIVGESIVEPSIRNAIYTITAVSVVAIIFLANKAVAKKISAVLFLFKPISATMKKVYDIINGYRDRIGLMLGTFMISIVSQLLYFYSIGILALSIGSRVSAINILMRMPMVSMMSLLPSINGLGVREGSTVVLFAPLIGKENAFAVSILVIFMLLITSLIGGLVYAFSPQFKIKFKEIKTEEVAI